MELILEQYLSILDIFDGDGNIIYSARPVEHVMRKLENEGSVTSSKDLKALQVHLDKIQKDYSTDEFASRQGKLKDKSLYSFTNSEKATLDSIEKNINLIYKYIQKQFNYMQKYLKYPLEELKRIVGVDMGHWWVEKEGGSGLYTGQSIRVLEYITGKPHYSTTNIQDAIETIKKSPYSGITTSSVFHDRSGFHAQYVADIEPIEIKERSTTGKINIKTEEVLFQDNTWGASEHQNTWVDLNGQLRTDYSDNRGGTLGYITNDKYRNGNLVNRVIGDMVLEETPETVENRVYKKITKNESREYKSPQYKDIIMEGKSPEANDVAESIHDALFVPSVNQIKIIKTFVKGMSEEQIKAKIKSIKYAMVNWESYYKRLLKRIKGIDNKHSILTEDDYNKLPNDDILKVKLEKAALKENYKITDKDPEIAKIKSVTDLNRFVKLQKQRAIKDFKYSFGKNISIVNYLLYSLDDSDIDKILKKYGITLSDDKYNKIFNTNSITDKQFDGSIKNTINTLTDNILTKFNKEVKNEDAKNEIASLLKRTFAKKIYFAAKDIDNPNISHIIEFVDRVYNPSDNAEFARIYRKIQNMTSKEFEDTVLSKVTNKDLNIKDFTGFSILKKIQRYEDKAEDILRNVVWADELYKVTEPSKHSIKYHPQKLYQKPSFVHNYNFDSSYREMKNDLSLLTLPKMFDKYKARNLDKYGVYPAYPKLECMSEAVFKYGFDTYIENIPELIAQIKDAKDLKEWLGYSDVLKNYMQKYRDNDVLSEKQFYELNKVLGKISTYIYDETSQDDIYKAAMCAMDIEKGSPFKNYKEYIKTIINKYKEYKKGCPIEGLDKQIEYNKTVLNKQTELFVKFFIRDRYQSDVYKTMQKYKNSLIRKSKTNDNQDLSKIYKEELWNEFHKYNILQQPDELLDKYLRSLASDSPLHEYESNYETLMNRALNYAMLYDIQSILMDALDEGVEMDVKSFFNDIEIPSADGTVTTMGSDKIIYNMVQSLVLDYQDETALKFLDKFGLNEIYVKESIKNFDFDELKNFIDEAYKVHRNYMEFEKKYNEIITKVYEKLDGGINPISTANKLKREFMQVLKTSDIDKTAAREFIKSLDNIAETCKENPQLKPKYVYNAVLTTAINELANNMQDDTDEVNSMFDSTNVNAQIMNKLVLYDKSEAYKLRKAFNKKLSDLLDYQDNLYRSLEKDDDSNLYLQENQESVKI
ncbi:MAG: hypothetical protein MJ230_04930 [bacterium]|nr:hypothetical protein [bacterium]